jgi:hypothetical protein
VEYERRQQGLEDTDMANAEVFDYTGPGGNDAPQDVVRIRVDPSVTSIPNNAFDQRKCLTEVDLCEGLVEIGEHATTRLQISTSPTHSGELKIVRSHALSELLFIFMIALKALEHMHSLAASSPTLESRPSSPWYPGAC